MESSYVESQIEILRRIAERGLKTAQDGWFLRLESLNDVDLIEADVHKSYIDLWQHMIDEIRRLDAEIH